MLTQLSTSDCFDHHYWLVGCNVEILAASSLSAETAIKNGILDIDYESLLCRWIRDFGPDLTEEQLKGCIADVIQKHQNGFIFRYNVGRN